MENILTMIPRNLCYPISTILITCILRAWVDKPDSRLKIINRTLSPKKQSLVEWLLLRLDKESHVNLFTTQGK